MNTSREQALRDIKQFLSLYDTGSWPGSTKYKMSIRIMKTNFRGENKSALKSELKEAIAKPEIKNVRAERCCNFSGTLKSIAVY